MPEIKIEGIRKTYDVDGKHDVEAIHDVSFTVEEGKFVCIVGPSGCGKSTLLEIIAGLQPADDGEVLLDGKKVTGPDRSIGVVFQDASLFPWRTIRKNILFGMEIAGIPKERQEEQLEKYIRITNLVGFENKYPSQLSGGMRQRAGLARTFVMNPEVILMDEPFSAVDYLTRCSLQNELINIWEKESKTAIFVTHDIGEVVLLADQVVLLSARPSRVFRVYDIPEGERRSRKSEVLEKIANQISRDINLTGRDVEVDNYGEL